jgi:hypothetical protein
MSRDGSAKAHSPSQFLQPPHLCYVAVDSAVSETDPRDFDRAEFSTKRNNQGRFPNALVETRY